MQWIVILDQINILVLGYFLNTMKIAHIQMEATVKQLSVKAIIRRVQK